MKYYAFLIITTMLLMFSTAVHIVIQSSVLTLLLYLVGELIFNASLNWAGVFVFVMVVNTFLFIGNHAITQMLSSDR